MRWLYNTPKSGRQGIESSDLPSVRSDAANNSTPSSSSIVPGMSFMGQRFRGTVRKSCCASCRTYSKVFTVRQRAVTCHQQQYVPAMYPVRFSAMFLFRVRKGADQIPTRCEKIKKHVVEKITIRFYFGTYQRTASSRSARSAYTNINTK